MAFGDFTVDRNSTKYVLGSGGSYVSYATDEPAFEFNSDGSYKGLLVEPASTNGVRNGSATGSTTGVVDSGGALPTNWSVISAVGMTTEVIGTGTENGVNYIDIKVSGTATGSTYAIAFEDASIISAADTEVWTNSAFLKLIDDTNLYDSVKLRTYNYTSVAFLNSNTGSAISVSTTSLDRFEETFTLSGATIAFTRPAIIFSLTSGNSYDFTVRIGWVQMEESPIATSPIPTTSAAVTRVLDNITQTGASSLIGQTEGTLYIEVDWKETTGEAQFLLSVNDGTSFNRMRLANASGNLAMFAAADGATLVNAGESSSGYSGIQKIAFAYKTDDFELYRNGSSIATDTSGSLAALATLTDIDLGQSASATAQANMHIRAAALFTRRLSASELGALTTL